MSAKICQCCGGTGWEGSECSDLRVKLLDLQRENDRLREFIAALPAPPSSRHFEEFQPSPESVRAWEGVDADKWLEEIRGTEVDL